MSADSYIAGSCNIGTGEVRRRQLVALVGATISAITLIGLVTAQTPANLRLGIFLPFAVTAIGYVQSLRKFCLAYGSMGTFNFGKLGEISRVSDKASLAADRKTALTILGQSLLLAAIATLIVYLLPLN